MFEIEGKGSERASRWKLGMSTEVRWPRVQAIYICVLWRGDGRGRNEDKREA